MMEDRILVSVKKSKYQTRKTCLICNTDYYTYKAKTQKYCSPICNGKRKNKNKIYSARKPSIHLNCTVCNKPIMAFTKTQKTCGSNECRRINGLKTNYKLLHNNWAKYLKSLCRSRKDPNLTKHFDEIFLIDLLKKQKYKCAISGEVLTCVAELNTDPSKKRRIHQTNASIDRIIPGAPYTKDNVQLVCLSINIARQNLAMKDFIEWCHKVSSYQRNKND
jgi:hypothetical protein